MAKKVILGLILTCSLLLTSCYPELSVQQYDKLRSDIAALDTERNDLESEVAALKSKNAESLAYVSFLEKLVSTQNSEKLLAGEFDTQSLINAKDELTALAANLGDNEIAYFLGLLKPDNNSLTVQSYYKVIEYCIKKLRQNLE